jgi:hypothetical protein
MVVKIMVLVRFSTTRGQFCDLILARPVSSPGLEGISRDHNIRQNEHRYGFDQQVRTKPPKLRRRQRLTSDPFPIEP